MAKQEIKTETTWSGERKEVIYENGKKIGETRHETSLFGQPRDRTYDTSGKLVSETRTRDTVFSGPVSKTYDTNGNCISETRKENTFFGERTVIVENGQRIAQINRTSTFTDALSGYSGRKSIKSYGNRNIDPLTRTTLREEFCPSTRSDSSYSYSSGASGSSVSPERITASPLEAVLSAKEKVELSRRQVWTKERLLRVLGSKKDLSFMVQEMRYLAQNSEGELKEAVLSVADNEILKQSFLNDKVVLTVGDLDKLSEPTLELIIEQEKPTYLFEGAVQRVNGSSPTLARVVQYKKERIGRLAIDKMSYEVLMSILLDAPPYVVDYCAKKFGETVLMAVAKGSSNPYERLRAAKKLYPNSYFRQYLCMQDKVGFEEVMTGLLYALFKGK
ncbi:MAG: hypothetical protein WCV90_05210 [Candidatus Woesearchaeota archaeon]